MSILLAVLTLAGAAVMLTTAPSLVIAWTSDRSEYRHVGRDRGKPVLTIAFVTSVVVLAGGLATLYGTS